jgi:hypothetical protein
VSTTYTYNFGNATVVTVTVGALNATTGGYPVTAITGTFMGYNITGEYGSAVTTQGGYNLDANGTQYDNIIFPNSSGGGGNYFGVDNNGLDFETSTGDDVNLYTSNSQFYYYDNTSSNSVTLVSTNAPCYVRGTWIETGAAEKPVECLTVGDHILTAAGERRPIKWIGRRLYAGPFLSANPNVQPVRFRAGCLGDGLPRRDLLVSPEHAMFLDGLLIPARCLVNGTTILEERGLDRVEYFHVELDTHDVLLAEDAPSETFLEDNNRSMFHNASEFAALYPHAQPGAGYCAPRVEQGIELETIWQRLAGLMETAAAA